MHFLHAAEIIWYACPIEEHANFWGYFYQKGVQALHLNIETKRQLFERLSDREPID
jgi:hypothetical protein